MESFVTVFLFFLVLSVEAEGFVIPTGSMAPTLMGRQKELNCPQCDQLYTVNADREVNLDGGPYSPRPQPVVAGVCPNCRFPTLVADVPNFQGDRIYVIKTPLNLPLVPALGEAVLERWDVAVFKLPEEPDVRYIKRLVGMPNEVLRIQSGDVWVRPRGSDAP
ncbi:MAG: S26 family signal peptidase, partial [Isosphaeraceae bacterium]